jgi:fimbrial chaperone protein
MSARGALRWSLALAMLAVASAVTAASFGLAPIGVTIAAGELSGSVVVTNTGTEDVVIQARPYAWTQNGEESRTETRELVINPPIFKLAVGEQQLVRVASRAAAPQQFERAYRVVFSELPAGLQTEPGFHIRVAMDIPLFVEPVVRSSAQLAWRVERTANGGRLVADNSGGRHFRLRDVRVQDGTKTIHTIPRIVVLAKSTLAIDLPEAAKIAQALRLTGQDDADQSVSIDIAAPRAP